MSCRLPERRGGLRGEAPGVPRVHPHARGVERLGHPREAQQARKDERRESARSAAAAPRQLRRCAGEPRTARGSSGAPRDDRVAGRAADDHGVPAVVLERGKERAPDCSSESTRRVRRSSDDSVHHSRNKLPVRGLDPAAGIVLRGDPHRGAAGGPAPPAAGATAGSTDVSNERGAAAVTARTRACRGGFEYCDPGLL